MTAMKVPAGVITDNLYVETVFGRDLFDTILTRYGKEAWNSYSDRLRRHNIWAMYSTPEPTESNENCMPVCLKIDLVGEDFSGADLSGLDLTIPTMDRCNFRDAKLGTCIVGSVARSSFQNADLAGADFRMADITGADFSGARLANAAFDGAQYDRREPPVQLTAIQASRCCPFPDHWDRDEDVTRDEAKHRLLIRWAELRSFWGPLK